MILCYTEYDYSMHLVCMYVFVLIVRVCLFFVVCKLIVLENKIAIIRPAKNWGAEKGRGRKERGKGGRREGGFVPFVTC